MKFAAIVALFLLLGPFPGASALGYSPDAAAKAPAGVETPPFQPDRFPGAIIPAELGRPLHVMLVEKAKQRLHLYLYEADGRPTLVRSFACSTGKAEGDKVREGDRRTPEGVYFFTKVYRDNKITLFGTTAYHLNYPDPFDLAEGRQGNGIYLHGTNRPLGSRATNGCVVMDNADLDFLSQRIRLYDTPIIIAGRLEWLTPEKYEAERVAFRQQLQEHWAAWSHQPAEPLPTGASLETNLALLLRQGGRTVVRVPAKLGNSHAGWRSFYLSEAGHGQQILAGLFLASAGPPPGPGPRLTRNPREEVLAFLQGWVKAWESCDVDRYIAHYSKQFKAYGMDYQRWRTYKAGLTRKYRSIDVEISDINITFKGGLALVSFNQKYWSDQYNDQGYKLMKLRQENGRWKVWREDWLPAQPMAAQR